MADNFVQRGEILDLTAPATVASGTLVIVGAVAGVALTDAEGGETVSVQTVGVFDLPAASDAVIGQGGAVSWDASAGECVAPASGMIPIGVCVAAKADGATVARVRLNGTATAAAA